MAYAHFSEIPFKDYLDQFKEQNENKKIRAKYNFSYWSSDIFKQCPWKYKGIVLEHRRGAEVDQRTSIEGTVLHSVMEKFLLIGEPDWSWPSAHADEVFDTMTAAAKVLTWKGQPDKDGARQMVRNMIAYATSYLQRKTVFDRYEIHPEYPFRALVLPDMTISGRTDVWLQDKVTRESEIIDWKGIKDPAKAKMDQMLFYGLGILAGGGGLVSRSDFCCAQIEFIKTFHLSEDQYKNFLYGLESLRDRVVHATDRKMFPKVRSGLCKYCGLQKECEEDMMGTITETFEGGIRRVTFD